MTSRPRILAISIVVLLAVAAAFYVFAPQPKIAVVADTHLWASEVDASRQNSIQPGPGKPIANVKLGDTLRVVRVVQGKDYVAAEVETTTGKRGWVLLYGQDGIRVVET